MASRIEIYWDGTAPGLAVHRLSLQTFTPSLTRLRKAVKSIATGLLSTAAGRSATSKRLAHAPVVDVQLALPEIRQGSLTAPCYLETLDSQVLLFMPDLAMRAGTELIQAIEAESQGRPRNHYVRRFLDGIPKSVTRQGYAAFDGSQRIAAVEFGEIRLAEMPESPPRLERVVGEIMGLSFGPEPALRLRSVAGKNMEVSATEPQIEEALRLRRDPVQALMVVRDASKRLLWVRRSTDPFPAMSESGSADWALQRWDEVLRRLSK
jgi:hypothetical protein